MGQKIEENKKIFSKRDFNKEYTWTPSREIDCKNPIKFIFTICNNRELAEFDDELISTKQDEVFINQKKVDLSIITNKVTRIENIQTEDGLQNLTEIPNDFYLEQMPYIWISELASYIRFVSEYGDLKV